jgi:hypothetical protein
MTRMKAATYALAILSAFPLALAQGSQPPGPPKEIEPLKTFDGSWTCAGNVPAGPLGPAHKSSSHVMIHKDLDGMWYSGRVEEAKTKENPHPFKGMVHMTYDPTEKACVVLSVDNTGGWAHQTTSGWESDRMTWLGEGSMMGKKIEVRDTFTKKGADLQHVGELRIDDKWVVIQDEVCKHTAAAM